MNESIRPDVITAADAAARAQNRPITDVIFDFGNVLVYWEPANALVSRYDRPVIDRFLDNGASGFFDANDLLDGGETCDEVVAWMKRHHGADNARMLRFYCDHFVDSLAGPVPGSRMLVADLKAAGVRVWGLSNWSYELFPAAWDRYEILHELDGKVISGFIGIRKPGREIFDYALRAFGITADTALFIDDKAMNVRGANAAGIRAVRFTDPFMLRQLLIDAGLSIPGLLKTMAQPVD